MTELNFSLEEGNYTVYERARLIGSRALQLSQGAKPLIEITPEQMVSLKYNPIEIAKREFAEGVIPLAIKRRLPHE